MEKLQRWLASLLKVDVVWIEKEDGDWVRRRNYHPVVKLAALLCVLLLLASAIWLGLKFFHASPETPLETETGIETRIEPVIETEIEILPDFPIEAPAGTYPEAGETPDELLYPYDEDGYAYPGPIPYGVNVADDEYWIRIIKSNFRLYLYRGQEVIKLSYVAVGRNPGDKERVGDLRTPRGIFTVQSVHDSRHWVFDFRDGRGPIRGAYGPWFIRLRTPPWRGIGIHGTHDPSSLGTMASEGCIRMRNEELLELMPFISINMTVVVEE